MQEKGVLAAYLFHQGTNYKAQEYLGAHREGERFVLRVWAPHAERVFAVGDFNAWQESDPMQRVSEGGIFEARVCAEVGGLYKFKIYAGGQVLYKADPYARQAGVPPETASVLADDAPFAWGDAGYLDHRARTMGRAPYRQPFNVYEMHIGSWRRRADGTPLGYAGLAAELAPYLKEMGYTHVELLPLAEHPFEGSWGYQQTGYFAPSARYGTPQELKGFVNAMHRAGIGVILDFVPAHFPKDAHGLYEFDGAPLYEYQGKDRMEHRGWGTRFFDVGREEVQCFLISAASYWVEEYHVDGLRMDAVASMLYLDYDRAPGEWVPNVYGDNRNLEATAFFRKLNAHMRGAYPDVLMIAEESTAWGNVTGTGAESLGFHYKWNMGWMNDTLSYAALDPIYRQYHHDRCNFSLTYAFSEHYVLPISHDEVVHGKRSLIGRMPGTYEQRFAGVRAFLGYMMTHPGKKLLFMGCEIGQFREWDHAGEVEWFLLGYDMHAKLQHYVAALNHFYLSQPPLYACDDSFDGFCWIDPDNAAQSVLSYRRRAPDGKELLVILNFTPVRREAFRQGMPFAGEWEEIFNSDLAEFGGTGVQNGRFYSEDIPFHGLAQSAVLTLPGHSMLILSCVKKKAQKIEKAPKQGKKRSKGEFYEKSIAFGK